jgi:hypothetical protein
MEYEVNEEGGVLQFFQKKDVDESASRYEEEDDEMDTGVEPDNTYFYFSIPLTGIRRVSPRYYKAGVNEIILRDTNEMGDPEYSVKLYKVNEYTFRLELTEETYNATKTILETATSKKAGRKTRRRLSVKTH